MGNPIFTTKANLKSKSEFPIQSYADVAGRVTASRRNRQSNSEKSQTPGNQINNDHPIRYLISQEELRSIPNPLADLDDIQIRQSRPRTISSLFGQEQTQRTSLLDFHADHQTMETVMERLRRQLRASSARVAQEAQLAHRERADQSPREQLERMRRVRQERLRTDVSLFSRWNNRTVPLMEVEESISFQEDVETFDSFPDHVFSGDSLDRRIAALIRPRE